MKVPAPEVTAAAAAASAGAEELPDFPDGAPDTSALQVAHTQLRAQLSAWIQHEPGVRLGQDPEELHQLRVAVRRIEATLGLFKHQLSPRLLHARRGAKGVLRTLGAVRDFDIQLAELERYCAKLPQSERAAAEPLRARLEQERGRARTRMIRALDSEATRHWLESLGVASADSSAAREPTAAPAALVMPERVRRRFKKLKKEVRRLGSKSTMEEYHAVRRRAKQLRYALECGAALFGKPAEEMLKALRRLQDGLGAQQDAYMAKNRLAALAADSHAQLPPETLFLMGRLAEHHLKETAQARKTLERSWRKVRGKRWKALRAKIEQLSATSRQASAAAAAALPEEDPAPKLEAEPAPQQEATRALRH